MEKISVAVPFFNTSQYINELLDPLLKCEYIDDIIINDDASLDEEFSKLENIIGSINSKKIKIYKNKTNVGGFKNKYLTIQYCKNDWVYLLDSDNFTYSGMIDKFILEEKNKKTVYFPDEFFFGSDSSIIKIGIGYNEVDLDSIKVLIKQKNNIINNFLNLCNFFVNKNNFLDSCKNYFEGIINDTISAENCSGGDCALMMYCLLKNNSKIKVIPGYKYFHRIRYGGFYLLDEEKSKKCVEYYKENILSL